MSMHAAAVRIEVAALGDDAGIVGAAALGEAQVTLRSEHRYT